jgi:hypothetical protein
MVKERERERGHKARDKLINMRDDTHTHVVVVLNARSLNWQGLEGLLGDGGSFTYIENTMTNHDSQIHPDSRSFTQVSPRHRSRNP